jgi:DNA-binding response OmpR family regulator
LLREVWQMSPDAGTNVVDVYVNYLRKKLGAVSLDEDAGGSVIETVRGEGYRMSIGKMAARVSEYPVSAAAFAGA